MKINKTYHSTSKGFTIVELLIVIVVIGILAAITIVAFNGITQRAVIASMNSDLANSVQTIKLYQADNNAYPSSTSLVNNGAGLKASNGTTYGYTFNNNASPQAFCLTAVNGSAMPRSTDQNGTQSDGPCPGVSGGQYYCPEQSIVAMNGYYCNGTVGSTATLNSNNIKQLASASGVPSGAPGYYVGVQTVRDNLTGSTITVAAGETYCFNGYAATASSGVVHTIGFMLNGPSISTTWLGVNNLSPSSTWQQLSGCLTIPTGYTQAVIWSQNNGDNTTSGPPWYQTALTIKKQ